LLALLVVGLLALLAPGVTKSSFCPNAHVNALWTHQWAHKGAIQSYSQGSLRFLLVVGGEGFRGVFFLLFAVCCCPLEQRFNVLTLALLWLFVTDWPRGVWRDFPGA
jgi:hypothetical protein